MRVFKQNFPVFLFILLSKMGLESCWAVFSYGAVLFEVVLTFESVDEILMCDLSREQYMSSTVLSQY